jgi:DNA-binding transcriptional LysR family regulator
MSEQGKDHLDLNGRLLQLLVAVVEEASITRAAERLGVTQSAVSHLLDKLRGIVGDPLFVKSGRGIVATARAEVLAVEARVLLDEMRRFAQAADFDPAGLRITFTIAANDLQRDLLLPALLDRLQARAPGISLRVIPSGVPSAEMLRDARCQLVISPRPPDAGDILQKRLFKDGYRVFYDARARQAPRSLADYLAADHVTVAYDPPRQLDVDQALTALGVNRHFSVRVPGFGGIAPFLRGSRRLATLPGLLGTGPLRDLANCTPPVECPPLPMYMIWHLRDRHDPVHAWLREELEAVASMQQPVDAG